MSNIDKQALREAAEKADSIGWDGIEYELDVGPRATEFISRCSPAAVTALLDELEAADALNKHLELAIQKAEDCSEALRRKAEAAEKRIAEQREYYDGVIADGSKRIAELESRTITVKLPDGWHFEECETDQCSGAAVYSVGAGMKNIHLCDECSRDTRYTRMKKTALPKRLPFNISAGISIKGE